MTVTIGRNFYGEGIIEQAPVGHVSIGDYVVLGAESVLIRHGPILPFKRDLDITVGDFTYIGRRCLILLGTEIGRCSVVGAGAVVKGKFPPYSILAGNPARVVNRRHAFEILRTFALKHRSPNPQLLGTDLNPPWHLLTKEDIIFLLRGAVPYDDVDYSRKTVAEIVAHYRQDWESGMGAA